MRHAAGPALAVFLAACPAEPPTMPSVTAAIARRADTIRFQARGVLLRCDSTANVLAEAVSGANGILIWLQFRDSLVRELPIIGIRDTITRPSAVVAARYSHQAVAHTIALDSGTVTVHDSGATRRLVVAGTGLDLGFGARAGLTATFADLPVRPDSTTSCARAP